MNTINVIAPYKHLGMWRLRIIQVNGSRCATGRWSYGCIKQEEAQRSGWGIVAARSGAIRIGR
jgi:hypothetical protein